MLEIIANNIINNNIEKQMARKPVDPDRRASVLFTHTQYTYDRRAAQRWRRVALVSIPSVVSVRVGRALPSCIVSVHDSQSH